VKFPKKRKSDLVVTVAIDEISIIEKYSSLSKLLRVVAYVMRWKCRVVNKIQFTKKKITLDEFNDSKERIIKIVQQQHFSKGINCLKLSQNVSNKSKLRFWRDLFLSDQHNQRLQEVANEVGVKWKFIPPRAPHFGGLWEKAVKSVKGHLRKILGNAMLTYEELYTVLVRIEACLNSRLITPLSSDPTDLKALIPGHFLIGGSFNCIPEADISTMS